MSVSTPVVVARGPGDDLDTGQCAAQQIDRLADAALELIGDLDLARLRGRHSTIVSPGGVDVTARSFHLRDRVTSSHRRQASPGVSPCGPAGNFVRRRLLKSINLVVILYF
jgi:hypothetical protein